MISHEETALQIIHDLINMNLIPSDTEQDEINRAVKRVAKRIREERFKAMGFEEVSEEQRARNMQANLLGIVKL